jgi:hypothetical protein
VRLERSLGSEVDQVGGQHQSDRAAGDDAMHGGHHGLRQVDQRQDGLVQLAHQARGIGEQVARAFALETPHVTTDGKCRPVGGQHHGGAIGGTRKLSQGGEQVVEQLRHQRVLHARTGQHQSRHASRPA